MTITFDTWTGWIIAGGAFIALAFGAIVLTLLMVGAVWMFKGEYKRWRLYSPHPVAKRIRAYRRARREARA